MDSISCRKVSKPVEHDDNGIVNYRCVRDAKGKKVFEPCEPVAVSLASDYDVISNSLYRGDSPISSRVNIDAVDVVSYVKSIDNSLYSK